MQTPASLLERCFWRGQRAGPAPRAQGQCPCPTRLQPSASGRQRWWIDAPAPRPTRLPTGLSSGRPRGNCPDNVPSRVLFPFPTALHANPCHKVCFWGKPNQTAGSPFKKDHSGGTLGNGRDGACEAGHCRDDWHHLGPSARAARASSSLISPPPQREIKHQSQTRPASLLSSAGICPLLPTCTAAPGTLSPFSLPQTMTPPPPGSPHLCPCLLHSRQTGPAPSLLRPSHGSHFAQNKVLQPVRPSLLDSSPPHSLLAVPQTHRAGWPLGACAPFPLPGSLFLQSCITCPATPSVLLGDHFLT